MSETRVLPADVYDTLEFSALVYGGIGAGSWWDGDEPMCLLGHANDAGCGGIDVLMTTDGGFLTIGQNDRAVRAINARKRNPDLNARVSWAEWCRELNIVRGDS